MSSEQDLNSELWEKTLSLLSRRDYSKRSLRQKLMQYVARKYGKDTSSDKLEDALAFAFGRAEDYGYLNEERFAQSLLLSKRQRGYGPKKIRAEFENHGLKSDCSLESVNEEDWIKDIVGIILRRSKWHDLSNYETRMKLSRHLYGKGYNTHQINQGIDRASAELESMED